MPCVSKVEVSLIHGIVNIEAETVFLFVDYCKLSL